MKGKTNWKKIEGMSEKEVLAAARADADSPPLTLSQLKQFKRVQPANDIDVKVIRDNLHLSQEQFANYFGVSVRTIQEWEQHRRKPTATARNFLKVIEREPMAVQKALSSNNRPNQLQNA
jgi:putative transcriptional regulator